MKNHELIEIALRSRTSIRNHVLSGCLVVSIAVLTTAAGAQEAQLFPNPDAALAALKEAVAAKDKDRIIKLFGAGITELSSGDEVQDASDRAEFAKRLNQKAGFVKEEDGAMILHVGAEDWPFPIPLVQKDNQWYFDTASGKEEIVNRRIGEGELNTIETCRAYVAAQREYASMDRDGDEVLEFAQKFASTPGQRDGLFWESKSVEDQSPLGPLVAEACAEGYGGGKKEGQRTPYHGYYYRILTKQGSDAPGGKYDYVINGNMIGGFALVATPAIYGSSGIMTFIVNQQGKVYQKDLGEKTDELAAALIEYNPEKSWDLAEFK